MCPGVGCVQDELQRVVFMVVCVRCHAADMTTEAKQSILDILGGPDMTANVAEAFNQRRRLPLEGEWPIVGGAHMEDMATLTQHLIKQLRPAMGLPDPSKVGGHCDWGGASKVSDWGEGNRVLSVFDSFSILLDRVNLIDSVLDGRWVTQPSVRLARLPSTPQPAATEGGSTEGGGQGQGGDLGHDLLEE